MDPLGLCPGDRKKCEQAYLQNYYGSFVANELVPNFSVGSYLPDSDFFADAWESLGEAALVKGGAVGALGLVSGYFSNLGWGTLASPVPGGPFGLQIRGAQAAQAAARAAVADTAATAASWFLTAIGTLGTSFATTADFIAYLNCRNEQQ
jgi:hypothetical protein